MQGAEKLARSTTWMNALQGHLGAEIDESCSESGIVVVSSGNDGRNIDETREWIDLCSSIGRHDLRGTCPRPIQPPAIG
jgi:hypothetical protein